jgi:hypothetical protein
MFVGEDAATDSEDHWAVAVDQGAERRVAALLAGDKHVHQVVVFERGQGPAVEEVFDLLRGRTGEWQWHWECSDSWWAVEVSESYWRGGA